MRESHSPPVFGSGLPLLTLPLGALDRRRLLVCSVIVRLLALVTAIAYDRPPCRAKLSIG